MSDHNPFKDALKKFKPKAKAEAPKPAPAPKKKPEADGTQVFSQAMLGVKPLKGQGRELAKVVPPAPAPAPVLDDGEGSAADHLKKLVSGELEFDLEFTDEYLEGHVRTLDPKIVGQLKAGSFSVEGHLDLHGQLSEQAQDAVLFFVRESYHMGRRCVLIVTGRGLNSPGGTSVLRREVQNWLTREPLRRVVLGFCTAKSKHGGAGALYVLLRKRKKTEGKVQFRREVNPYDDEW